jgi:hypothetical protein
MRETATETVKLIIGTFRDHLSREMLKFRPKTHGVARGILADFAGRPRLTNPSINVNIPAIKQIKQKKGRPKMNWGA